MSYYWATNVELPAGTDLNSLLNDASLDGVKVIDQNTTGPTGGKLYTFVGGQQGQIISLLTRRGIQPNQYTMEVYPSS